MVQLLAEQYLGHSPEDSLDKAWWVTGLVELQVGPQMRYIRLSKAILEKRELPREETPLICRASPRCSAEYLSDPLCGDLNSWTVSIQKNKKRGVLVPKAGNCACYKLEQHTKQVREEL